MNYPAMQFWFNAINTLGLIALGIYTWWRDREKVNSTRFVALEKQVTEMVSKPELQSVRDKRDQQVSEIKKVTDNVTAACCSHPEMRQRLDGHNDRLGQHKELIDLLSGEMKHLPKTKDLSHIHSRIDQVFGLVREVEGEVKGIARNLTLVLDHHLKER